MKYLLDTHMLLWSLEDSEKLPEKVRKIIDESKDEIYYSSVSIWETEIKHLKRPDDMRSSSEGLASFCDESGFRELTLKSKHVHMLKTLSLSEDSKRHNDPFDRILISQAKSEGMIFITHDDLLPYYNENCILYV